MFSFVELGQALLTLCYNGSVIIDENKRQDFMRILWDLGVVLSFKAEKEDEAMEEPSGSSPVAKRPSSGKGNL